MSSDADLPSIVAEIQFGNYLSIAIATAVAYDYLITLPKEINYIWTRSWSFVSWMFIVVRYTGLFLAMNDAFYATPFIPGPVLASTVLLLLRIWIFIIFLAATDIMMILRVHAMYNRSKTLLSVLLVLYVSTLVLYAVSGGYYHNSNTLMTMTVAQVLNMSFCNPVFHIQNHYLGTYKVVPRLVLAGLLVTFAIARFFTESYQTYKATKQWRSNQYLTLLTKQGVLYFLGHFLYAIGFDPTVAGSIVTTISTVVVYILSPRFIMSVRELYFCNLYGWDRGIDSGFGMWKGQFTPVPPSITVGFTSETAVASEEDVEMQWVKSTGNISVE